MSATILNVYRTKRVPSGAQRVSAIPAATARVSAKSVVVSIALSVNYTMMNMIVIIENRHDF
jgi:hypothetical protein